MVANTVSCFGEFYFHLGSFFASFVIERRHCARQQWLRRIAAVSGCSTLGISQDFQDHNIIEMSLNIRTKIMHPPLELYSYQKVQGLNEPWDSVLDMKGVASRWQRCYFPLQYRVPLHFPMVAGVKGADTWHLAAKVFFFTYIHYRCHYRWVFTSYVSLLSLICRDIALLCKFHIYCLKPHTHIHTQSGHTLSRHFPAYLSIYIHRLICLNES